jgi:hypothetical protein
MIESHEKIFLEYKGPILYDTIGDLISLLKETMFEAKVKQTVYKKVLMIMIEALENIFKYHEFFGDNEELISKYPPSICIKYSNPNILVTCSNPILKVDSDKLKSRLEKINKLDKAGIKEEYKQTITNGQFSEKGGAGLGIIEMAKISDDKLTFSFNHIDEEYNNYELNLKIKC